MICRSGREPSRIHPLMSWRAPGLFLLLFVAGCGGGGSPDPVLPAFPPLTSIRSDLLDPTEGLAGKPLRIAAPPCVYLPAVQWQNWLCSGAQSVPTVYLATNAFTTAPDPRFAWIIVRNNEFVQTPGCNTGPPNQSLGANEYPFTVEASEAGLRLRLEHDARPFCGKIPYLSAAYLRGVQGDALPRLMGWGELAKRTLRLDLDLIRTNNDQVWMRVLLHFRDKTGQRYFVNTNYVFPDALPSLAINWNWPYVGSFQYPGARIFQPAQDPEMSLPNGAHRLDINVRQEALAAFPEFSAAEPDFLGVEIALELGPIQNAIEMTIRSVQIL